MKRKKDLALVIKNFPQYSKFLTLLNENASMELDVKELTRAQMLLVSKYSADSQEYNTERKRMSEQKAKLLDKMANNELEMSRIKIEISRLSLKDGYSGKFLSNLITELDEAGLRSGIHGLDFSPGQLTQLKKLSEEITQLGFTEKYPVTIMGPIDPCWCQGCSGCTGCSTLCQATCGNCIGCSGSCSGCSGCSEACKGSITYPKK